MVPNHRQLIGLLAEAEPAFLAGSFATDFQCMRGRRGSAARSATTRPATGTSGWTGLPSPAHPLRVEDHHQRIGRGWAGHDRPATPAALVPAPSFNVSGQGPDDWQLDVGWPITGV